MNYFIQIFIIITSIIIIIKRIKRTLNLSECITYTDEWSVHIKKDVIFRNGAALDSSIELHREIELDESEAKLKFLPVSIHLRPCF